MSRPRRSTFQITIDLLEAVWKHSDWPKSKVCTSVGVNYTDRLPLIKHLIERGFIKIERPKRSKQKYRRTKSRSQMVLTDKGMDWLINAKKLVKSVGLNDY